MEIESQIYIEGFETSDLPDGVVKTQEEAAIALNVAVRTIQRWIEDGMPLHEQGYDILAIQEWYNERKKNKIQTGSTRERNKWETEYKKHKAQMAELELNRRKGLLIDKDRLNKERIQRILAVKERLLAIPRSVSPILVGMDSPEIEATLMKYIRECINEFSRE